MAEGDGLQWALRFDGAGGGRELTWNDLLSRQADGPLWIHVDRDSDRVSTWLSGVAGLPAGVAEILLAEETRPRVLREAAGVLIVLRAVNLNPGAQPDDMIAIRLWADAKRVISLRQRKLRATFDVVEAVRAGHGPTTPGRLLTQLTGRIVDRVEEAVSLLVENVGELEEAVTVGRARSPRRTLSDLRSQVICMHRHMAPQRQVLGKLAVEEVPWLEDADRSAFRELAERTTRLVEELDALRERGKVISDELNLHMSENLNRRMYLLSLVAAIFLPLSLIAGLMGANVGGIPGADNQSGFWVLCVGLLVLGVVSLGLLHSLGWAGGMGEDG